MKNVLFISPTGGYAGIDVSLEMLVCGLDRDRFNPVVVFPLESRLKAEFEKQKIRCYSLPLNWWFPMGFSGNDIVTILPTLRDKIEPLVQIIRDNQIDLVFSNTTVGMDGAVAAGIAGVPHVFFAHAQFVSNIYTNMSEQIREYLYRLMGRLSDRFICCSQPLRDVMSRYMDNATCILNGVDTQKFAFHARSASDFFWLDMVCVGHYNANKQQDFVLRALNIIRCRNPEVMRRIHFTMMGPGESGYVAELRSFVKKNHLSRYVTFDDFHDDIPQQLNNYTVYVNSSVTENFPISVLEAMSNGLPVLAAPNDGTLQLVEEGKTGYICDTPEVMAERMIFLLEHPEKLESFSAAARDRVERLFSRELFVQRFQDEFDAVLEKADARHRVQPTRGAYELLTSPARKRYAKLKVLVIYPREAIASYAIAAEKPLDELKKSGLVEYRAVDPSKLRSGLIEWADIVYCIRFYDDAIYKVLKTARGAGKPFIWYIDDNYFAIRFEGGDVRHQAVENRWFERMFHDSSAVVVNSGELYHAGNFLKSNIYRLPTYQIIDEDFSIQKTEEKPFIRFGFMGTLKRDQDFAFVIPAIERVLKEYGSRIQIDFIGYVPEELRGRSEVNTFDFIYDYDEFRRFFRARKWDFALAPLSDTAFNRSKTNNKYREYSSFAIPGIYSDIVTYHSCIENGRNGLLVKNEPEAWYEAICKLICSPELRANLAKAAFEDIRDNYPIYRFSDGLIDIFQRAVHDSNASLTPLPQKETHSILGRDDLLCFSKNILKDRSYRIDCGSDSFDQLGVLFASEEGRCDGEITLEIFSAGRELLATAKKQMQQIVYNQWNYFEFSEIEGRVGQPLMVRLSFQYDEGSGHMGVYEDRRNRTFLYRVFHYLGLPLPGRNVLVVDYASE